MSPSLLQGKLILVVDDEPLLREVICEELAEYGCRTLEATDGVEALKVCGEHQVDGIVTDFLMPNKNGVDLIRRIRAQSPEIPIVLLTGLADISEREAREQGATALIVKPFYVGTIVEALTSAFEYRHSAA